MTSRKALGRGLSSLIPEAPKASSPGLLQIDVGLIHPSRDQPRKSFDDSKLDGLAQSVREHGVLQPVVVRKDGAGYRLIVGERRWRAAVKAGLRSVPVILKEVDDRQRLEMALVENIQREDLNPLEEARACRMLVDDFELTQETIAARLGMSPSHLSNLLRLLELDPKVQALIETGKLTMGHARALAGIEAGAVQREVAAEVVKKGLSVRATERLVRGRAQPSSRRGGRPPARDANVRAAEEQLRTSLGVPVRITGAAHGRIEIEFQSKDELQRLYNLLLRARPAPPPAAGVAPRATRLPASGPVR